MIKLEHFEVFNFEGAMRGMRNPKESWNKSDSQTIPYSIGESLFDMGENDFNLALKLAVAGSDHAKYLRQIMVCVDITAPLYWWKQMDTYKVGTVANSKSTMHKLGSRYLNEFDFSWDDEDGTEFDCTERQEYLQYLNRRIDYLMHGDVKANNSLYMKLYRRLVQDLPCSFNQTRTWTANYEVLRKIYHSRKNHKLREWREMCEYIETLPYADLITTESTK